MSEKDIVSVQSEPFLKLVYYEGFVLLHTYFRFIPGSSGGRKVGPL